MKKMRKLPVFFPLSIKPSTEFLPGLRMQLGFMRCALLRSISVTAALQVHSPQNNISTVWKEQISINCIPSKLALQEIIPVCIKVSGERET